MVRARPFSAAALMGRKFGAGLRASFPVDGWGILLMQGIGGLGCRTSSGCSMTAQVRLACKGLWLVHQRVQSSPFVHLCCFLHTFTDIWPNVGQH